MAKNKNLKRKTTPFVKDKRKETAPTDEESASEQEVNFVIVGEANGQPITDTFLLVHLGAHFE